MIDPEAILIRHELPSDANRVRVVNEVAFGESDEADLIDRLRAESVVLVSFVAEVHQTIIGHVMFCRLLIEGSDGTEPAVALAPLAVMPAYQGQGVGTVLVREGLEVLRSRGESLVLVLGEPLYYERFGFSCASARGLKSPFQPEFFMALALKPHARRMAHGTVRYPAAFRL